jgi:hypothetical protein
MKKIGVDRMIEETKREDEARYYWKKVDAEYEDEENVGIDLEDKCISWHEENVEIFDNIHKQVKKFHELHFSSPRVSRHICNYDMFDKMFELYLDPCDPLKIAPTNSEF